MLKHKYQNTTAFTLAEVLITIAVIGVVAAMVIPSLQSDINEDSMNTAAKKAYAELNEAFIKFKNDNGGVIKNTYANRFDLRDIFLRKYFSYTKYAHVGSNNFSYQALSEDTPTLNSSSGIYASSGIYYGVEPTDGSCFQASIEGYCTDLIFDVNGRKKPNRIGYDIFEVTMTSDKIQYNLPTYAEDHSANNNCIKPGAAGWNAWTNKGRGCLKRILLGQNKWSSE